MKLFTELSRFQQFTLGVIFCILAVPSVVLVGWILHNEVLKRVFPNIVEMNPMTAICFLCLGTALLCMLFATKKTYLYQVAQLIALIPLTITIIMMLKYVLNIDVEIDQILFRSQLSGNRMAPNTTVNFILVSFTLLAIDLKVAKKYWFSYLCVAITTGISVLVLIGYLYNFTVLYRVATFIPMALHTAICFLLCCVTIICLRSERGFLFLLSREGIIFQTFQNLRIRTKLSLAFGALITLLLLYSAVIYIDLIDLRTSQQDARQSAFENKIAQVNLRKYEKQFLLSNNEVSQSEDFYLNGKNEDVQKWFESYQQFTDSYQKIERFESTEELPDINNDVVLNRAVKNYHDAFLQLVEKQRKIGFYIYGDLGQARSEARLLETLLPDDDSKMLLLQLRRREKDFLLRENQSDLDLYDEEIARLRSLLTTNDQREHLNTYEMYFTEAVTLKKEVGLTEQTGLRAVLNESMEIIEPIVDQTQVKTAQIIQEKISLSIKLTISLAIFFVILGVVFSFTVSRFISESINHIRNAALAIMQGKEVGLIPIETRDEVGDLAEALNRMTSNLQHSQSILEQKNISLAKSIEELNSTKKATLNVLEDLEESKHKIEQEKAKDEAILSSIGDGVIVTDSNRVVLFVNGVAENMIGWKVDEIKGKVWGVDLPKVVDEGGNDIPQDHHALGIALRERKKATAAYVYILKDGSNLAVSVTASPVIIDDELVGSIVVFRDVTREREVDRMKTEFISLASHQLRTPLTAMRWFSEMLLAGDGGELNPQQAEFVKNISDSNKRMIELVNSLLNISRIESGRLIVEPEPTDMKELLESVLVELRPRFDAKKQQLIVSVHHELSKVNVDPKLIRQVFSNLLTNALKYTPDGGEISIFISQKNSDIVSQVSDTGYGIPLKEQSKVFQKFYRGENIISIETDGTGLGLYLIKAIIESSGGKIWFESKEKVGTSFYFSIPMTGMIAKKGEVRIDQ